MKNNGGAWRLENFEPLVHEDPDKDNETTDLSEDHTDKS